MKKILLVILFFRAMISWSQNKEPELKTNTKELKKLSELAEQKYKADSIKIAAFLRANPAFEHRSKTNGVLYEIVEIVEDKPVYRSTDNLSSSMATKTNSLQVGGTLGLNLTGNNMAIGVWEI